MSTENSSASQGIPWLLVALVCLAAGVVVPGWVDAVPESLEPWAFISVGIIALAAMVMSIRGHAPAWMKVATSIMAVLATLGAVTFAGLSLMM